jgi:hypothetical protein
MDAKAKRKVIADMLARLQRDMDMAVEQMPDDWYEKTRAAPVVHGGHTLGVLGMPLTRFDGMPTHPAAGS